jgi:hypothetical protein
MRNTDWIANGIALRRAYAATAKQIGKRQAEAWDSPEDDENERGIIQERRNMLQNGPITDEVVSNAYEIMSMVEEYRKLSSHLWPMLENLYNLEGYAKRSPELAEWVHGRFPLSSSMNGLTVTISVIRDDV